MRTTLIAALILLSSSAHAIEPGDIAFTAFNGDAENFAFTSWIDIAPDTTLFFTDKTWSSASQSFGSSEGWLSWNSGSGSKAGEIVVIYDSTLTASSGNITSHGGSFDLSASGETLYAYLGTPSAPTSILAALSTEGVGSLTGITASASLIALPNSTDFADYTGARSGLSQAEARSQLANPLYWSSSTGDGKLITPNLSAFSLTPVPEPSSLAMILASLGMMGFIARRRRS